MSTRKFTPCYAVTSSILVRSMGDHSYQKSTKNTRIIILGSFVVDFEQKMGKKLKTDCTPLVLTLALSRSTAFMSEPWKYLTRVCCRFSRPSNSRSGSALEHHSSDSLSQSNFSTMTIFQKLDVNVIYQEKMSLLQVRHSIECHRG